MTTSDHRRLGSKYTVGKRIGQGGMGVVYEGTAEGIEAPVAVKLLRPDLAEHPRTVAMFVQERSIFETLDHPNIVKVHDLVVESGELGIVMELVPGGDLRSRLDAGLINPREAIRIAREVASGLEAIHAAGVVHRDLKPANILLGDEEEPNPKISDFGISRLASDALTKTSSTIGTPIYMAPESTGVEPVGASADVYSLGIILFEMLIGHPPFNKGGTMAVINAHATKAPPQLQGVPEGLSDLVDRMLGKSPFNRPTAAEVKHGLAAVAFDAGADVSPWADPDITGRLDAQTVVTPGVASSKPAGEDSQAETETDGPPTRTHYWTALAVASLLLVGGAVLAVVQPWSGSDSTDDSSTQLAGPGTDSDQTSSSTTAVPDSSDDGGGAEEATTSAAPTTQGTVSTTTTTTTTPTTAAPTTPITAAPTAPTTVPTTSPPSTSDQPPIVPAGRIVFTGTVVGYEGKCLDIRGAGRDNGTPVQIWDCVGVANQQWNLTEAGELRGFGNKCLDVRGPSSNSGTPVQIWDCVDVPQQRWVLNASGELRGYSGLCLDVRGPSRDNGTPVQVWDCVDVPQQHWVLS